MASDTDCIHKRVVLRSSRSRVWRALTDPSEFSRWFGVELKGKFEPGAQVSGAVKVSGYEHCTLEVHVVTMEPEWLFSWRWHPNAIDPRRDYSQEPKTLVTFELQDVSQGTLLTVVESGFDAVPVARREEAHRANDGGWTHQMNAIARYLQEYP